jgi:hypothetical protein
VVKRAGCGKLMHSIWALPGSCDSAQSSGTPARSARPAPSATVLKAAKVRPDAGGRRRRAEPTLPSPNETVWAAPIPAHDDAAAELTAHSEPLPTFVKVIATALTPAEASRRDGREHVFVQRGIDLNSARALAASLVERDRTGSRAGSCAECQCFVDPQCPCPSTPHEVAELHSCPYLRKNTP